MGERRDKINYYLDIAQTVSTRSTCMRRNYGAIIVKNDQIISTGYVGAPRGRKNCTDLQYCTRESLHIPNGERYELCRSVHAEQNAIIAAARTDMLGASLYLACLDYRTKELVPGTNPCANPGANTRADSGTAARGWRRRLEAVLINASGVKKQKRP